MMAAIEASKGHEVILIEKNEKLGKKLFITGKGRCNITNNKDISEFFNYIPTNPHFLYSSLYTYTNEDTKEFFETRGIKLKVERGDRVFPFSDKSSDIIKGFQRGLSEAGVKVLMNTKVVRFIVKDKHIEAVVLDNGNEIKCDYVIVATGGASYPQTGSNGEGYSLCEEIGHNIIDIKPSLVPMEIEENWVDSIKGLSLKNIELTITKNNSNKPLYKEQGEMLFTYYGISGPLVLSASSLVKEKGKYTAHINLKPALNEKALDLRIQRDFLKYSNKDFKNSLEDLLPKKLIPVVIALSGIPEEQKVNTITKEQRRTLLGVISDLKLHIKSLRPVAEAIVTSGGIDTREIDPSTMKSKIINNLSFAGEVIDVDAFTGGYNVQIAISTGYLAGNKLKEE